MVRISARFCDNLVNGCANAQLHILYNISINSRMKQQKQHRTAALLQFHLSIIVLLYFLSLFKAENLDYSFCFCLQFDKTYTYVIYSMYVHGVRGVSESVQCTYNVRCICSDLQEASDHSVKESREMRSEEEKNTTQCMCKHWTNYDFTTTAIRKTCTHFSILRSYKIVLLC